LGILAGMLAYSAPAAVASPSPGGEEALWDGDTIPPLFGAIESDVANDAVLCFLEDYYGDAITVEGGPFCDGAQEVYFAAVGNGEDFGLGAAQTSVTIQNIDYVDAYIFFYVGNGDGWDVNEYAYLAAGASKTFSADDLGIAEGAVVPVVAVAYHVLFAIELCDYYDDGDYYDCGSYGEYPGDWNIDDYGILADPAFIAGVAKQAVIGDLLPTPPGRQPCRATTQAGEVASSTSSYPDRPDQPWPRGCWGFRLRSPTWAWTPTRR
jgi:hypothetical protein